MPNHYIVSGESATLASSKAVQAHAAALIGGNPSDPSFQTIRDWSEDQRRALGIWLEPDQVVRPPLLKWQRYGSSIAALVSGDVVETYPVSETPFEKCRTQLIDELAAMRYGFEVGGCIAGGIFLNTQRENRANYVYHEIKAQGDPAYTVNWKVGSAVVPLDAATMIAVTAAVVAHVQACYDNEGVILQQIMDAGVTTVDDLRAIDISTGWPTYE